MDSSITTKINKEELDKRNRQIFSKKVKNTHTFIIFYFNELNEFINTYLPNQAPITVSSGNETGFLYPKGHLNAESRIALFLDVLRNSIYYNHRDDTSQIADEVYKLKYLYYWNEFELKSSLLKNNLVSFFGKLKDELKIESDFYSPRELKKSYFKYLKQALKKEKEVKRIPKPLMRDYPRVRRHYVENLEEDKDYSGFILVAVLIIILYILFKLFF